MRRGPSRLIWFGLGGIATYWFIQSREQKREMLMSQGADTQRAGHCHAAWGWGRWGDHRREMNEAQQKMEDHRRKVQEQFADFGNIGGDKLADMAESSLDSVMSSVVALKQNSELHRKLLEPRRQRKILASCDCENVELNQHYVLLISLYNILCSIFDFVKHAPMRRAELYRMFYHQPVEKEEEPDRGVICQSMRTW
ncbi:hypothetical protein AG1IA_00665 [Rhizoctonia solani AG-1 IA]|uniref:Uncharacterized protein n=1 Tax=Thanatephorus cucumeris (strain AG1-IA) TaxID=983506 RepID=L8X548_THACA|nr:hypothetical protein AG1IA_00665 [Rhizoctonia solani AG-1 IA]